MKNIKYMRPIPCTFKDVYQNVFNGKPTVKDSLVMAIRYSKDYREWSQAKRDKYNHEVSIFEFQLKHGLLQD